MAAATPRQSRAPLARPRPDLPDREAVAALVDGEARLAVRVTPGARSEGLEIAEGKLLVRVRAKPEDGKANAAVRDLLAAALQLAPSRIELLRGATSREKLFRITGTPLPGGEGLGEGERGSASRDRWRCAPPPNLR